MPQIKSAIKRVKTSEKSHLRNISYKSKIKSIIKRFNLALSENNKEESIKYFKNTVSILDKSVNKGILPKNTASRQKSSLTKKLSTLIKLEPAKKSTPAALKKVVATQEKPVAKKVRAVKVAKKPAVSKKKTETKKTVKAKEKPIAKKRVKVAKKPATTKTKTTKTKS